MKGGLFILVGENVLNDAFGMLFWILSSLIYKNATAHTVAR